MTRRILHGMLLGVLAATLLGVALAWLRTLPPARAEAELPVLQQLPAFELEERSGRTVRNEDLADAPWVVDFIFTRCAMTCPRMTSQMLRLGRLLPADARRVSITVDPEVDTLEVLRDYASAYGIADDDRWWFLRGDRDVVRALVTEGFLLAVGEVDPQAPEPILHSERFVLVDGQGHVRGYYDAFEEGALERLADDARALGAAVAAPGGMS